MIYKDIIKRSIDLIIALITIVIFIPIHIIISIIIWQQEFKGPIFYKQNRLGKNGKEFKIIKYRTMMLNAENTGTGLFTNDKDPRITKVGLFLRKFSIDEIPQLINIIKGDMSLIGPRPPVPYHPYVISEYPENFKVRFQYRPGITGWAQVHGRTNLTWIQRLEYDVEYDKAFSFALDVKIFFLTVNKILKRENVFPSDIYIGKSHIKQ